MKSNLSEREQQVLDLAVQGYTDDMIANALSIEKGTVNSYWVRIRSKLGHLSRTHLVANYVQSNADVSRAAGDAANRTAVNALAQENTDILERERAAHRDEMQNVVSKADQASAEQREALDSALEEIERLKELLRKKSK